ncbi:hypothetical protein Ahy_B10g102576 [Arachis hypogaea]|uniref:B-like cyclin n=1 Tax=Arachis hypogaea TaxID=3818 RepID=A0A444X240_ARAHY|nr:hypothetical protein Ahy_B10g102576 [Arachis hypogaea]
MIAGMMHRTDQWRCEFDSQTFRNNALIALYVFVILLLRNYFSSLAINYLHRFLFTFTVKKKQSWLTYLATVACISLAAKMEETQVSLPLDLQVEDNKYVFEAKIIKKMEILVLSTLE